MGYFLTAAALPSSSSRQIGEAVWDGLRQADEGRRDDFEGRQAQPHRLQGGAAELPTFPLVLDRMSVV